MTLLLQRRREIGDTAKLQRQEVSRHAPKGETLLYMISDDNFSMLQRTLLLTFELR